MSVKGNKKLLFVLMGFGGGAVGAIAAQLVFSGEGTFLQNLIFSGLWAGFGAAFIALALAWASEVYHRKEGFPYRVAWYSLRSGAVAGILSGAGAQAVFSMHVFDNVLFQMIFQIFCWGIMGALLGGGFARFMSNMSKTKALIAGGAGGLLGGIIFVFIILFVPLLMGHILGFGVMGASLGLALVITENIFRQASVDVVWAPKEVTTITLGSKPVYLGGGDDHIYIKGLPEHALSMVVENHQIVCRQLGSSQSTYLKNGSTINVGQVQVVIRTKS